MLQSWTKDEGRERVRDIAVVLAKADYLERHSGQDREADVWAVRNRGLFRQRAVEGLALMLAVEEKGDGAFLSHRRPVNRPSGQSSD